MSIAHDLYLSAKRSHAAAQAYLTGTKARGVPTYDTDGVNEFARQMAMGCMRNAYWTRRMLQAIKKTKPA